MTLGKLEVKVAPGYVDSEYYVMVPDGPSALVSRDLVFVNEAPREGGSVDGRVQVYILSESNDQAVVELPGEAVVGGLRTTVDRALLAS